MSMDPNTGNTAEPSGKERRRHQRHEINLKRSVQTAGGDIPVMDISWGGISFYAPRTYRKDTKIEFQTGSISVIGKVVGCDPLEAPQASPELPYRVRCQFEAPPSDPGIVALMDFVLDQEGIGEDLLD